MHVYVRGGEEDVLGFEGDKAAGEEEAEGCSERFPICCG